MRVFFRKLVVGVMLSMIDAYKLFISPFLGRNCRFEPGCSSYAIDVIRDHGPFRGLWLTSRRISRCHPWSKGGVDMPPKRHWH